MDSEKTEPLIIETVVGQFAWSPNLELLEKYFYGPLREAIAKDEKENPWSDACDESAYWLPYFLRMSLHDAVSQAVDEVIATAKARSIPSKYQRGKVAKEVADSARRRTHRRLQVTGYFPKTDKQEKIESGAEQSYAELIDRLIHEPISTPSTKFPYV